MPLVMEKNEKFDYLFKIVLIGDSGVGKTNLLSKLIKNEFLTDSKATIGVEFGTMTFKVDDSTIKAQIWDTAGQERYQAIVHAYYRGTAGAVLVYDITNKKSLKRATDNWLVQLRNFAQKEIPIMLVGNKKDLTGEREIDTRAAEEIALANDLCFFETSALSGENVKEAFYDLLKSVYHKARTQDLSRGKQHLKKDKYLGEDLGAPINRSGCC